MLDLNASFGDTEHERTERFASSGKDGSQDAKAVACLTITYSSSSPSALGGGNGVASVPRYTKDVVPPLSCEREEHT